jgi:hypothetical protein
VAPVLSQAQLDLLQGVKSGATVGDEPEQRQHYGALKRQGLVAIERGDKGDKVTLTDKGKAFLKEPVTHETQAAEAAAGAEQA